MIRQVVMNGASDNDVADEFEMLNTSVRTNVSRVKKWITELFGELPESFASFC